MEEFISGAWSHECYKEFFVNGNFFDKNCLALGLSKLLGFGVILGSTIIKVPQILKILGAKSATGIDLESVLLELFSYMVTIAYSFRQSFPFSTYGELTFISAQNLVIVFLIFLFGGGISLSFFGILAGYFILLYLFLFNSSIVDWSIILFLQNLNIGIIILSRLRQIWSNLRAKSTGQLAFLTWFLQFAGTAARVFTTLQETNDKILLTSFLVSVVLNGIVVLQIVYYGDSKLKNQ